MLYPNKEIVIDATTAIEFIESERVCFSLKYDEGAVWHDGKGGEDCHSRQHRNAPYNLFTIGSQRVRGTSVLDVIEKAMVVRGAK